MKWHLVKHTLCICIYTRGVPKVTELPKFLKNYGSQNYQTRCKYNMVSCDIDKTNNFIIRLAIKSKTAWAQTYYRRSWQKHIAAKTRQVKSINLLNFMFNIVSFTSNAFPPAWHNVHDSPLEESSRLSLDPRLNAVLDVIHASIVIFALRFFGFA